MDYSSIARRACAMIRKYGSEEHFEVVRGGGVRIVGGVEVYENETTQRVSGFVRRPKANEIDGERILATDMLGNFTPCVQLSHGDNMIIYGDKYTIVDLRPLVPGGHLVSYRPILRRVAVNG